jgi:hypothetical protein
MERHAIKVRGALERPEPRNADVVLARAVVRLPAPSRIVAPLHPKKSSRARLTAHPPLFAWRLRPASSPPGWTAMLRDGSQGPRGRPCTHVRERSSYLRILRRSDIESRLRRTYAHQGRGRGVPSSRKAGWGASTRLHIRREVPAAIQGGTATIHTRYQDISQFTAETVAVKMPCMMLAPWGGDAGWRKLQRKSFASKTIATPQH